jgi:alanine racemase
MAIAAPGPVQAAYFAKRAYAYGHGMALLVPKVVKLRVPCIGIASNAEARIAREKGFLGRILRLRTPAFEELEAGLGLGIEELLGNAQLAERASRLMATRGSWAA